MAEDTKASLESALNFIKITDMLLEIAPYSTEKKLDLRLKAAALMGSVLFALRFSSENGSIVVTAAQMDQFVISALTANQGLLNEARDAAEEAQNGHQGADPGDPRSDE